MSFIITAANRSLEETCKWGTTAQRYGIKYQLYPDDTQLYVSLDPGNKADAFVSSENLEHCIADIQPWVTNNVLKLNENKTSIIHTVL